MGQQAEIPHTGTTGRNITHLHNRQKYRTLTVHNREGYHTYTQQHLHQPATAQDTRPLTQQAGVSHTQTADGYTHLPQSTLTQEVGTHIIYLKNDAHVGPLNNETDTYPSQNSQGDTHTSNTHSTYIYAFL